MKKILASFVAALACCVIALCAGCGCNDDEKKPEKLKDGIALTITAGESTSVDLSEYISVEGTEYAYTVESSDNSVATVSLDGNTATVTAVAEGSAEITASADEAEVKFAVTVNKKPVQPKPAPVFSDKTVTYDLKDKQSEQITLAPDSGEATYSYAYALKEADEKVTISGDKLTAAYTSATEKTLTVVATYTDSSLSFTGEKTVEFKVTVKVTDTREPDTTTAPSLKENAVTVEKDMYTETEDSFTIDFAANVANPDEVELHFAVKKGEDDVTLTGTTFNFEYGTYGETATTVVYNVKITFTVDGTEDSLEYNYTLNLKDTSAYRAANGGFDNGLDGWTMEGDIGEISESGTFWEQNFPMFNDGKYFRGDGKESGKGTLTSSAFKVGGVNKISFKLGAAGNNDCYITLEKTDGTVLAVWRNKKFKDESDWQAEEIGKTQFACNLVQYVADLTTYAGEEVKIVLHDNAENGFGFFNFDSLVTYYATAADVPAGFAALNEMADKTELSAAVQNAVAEKGDYTEESFASYRAVVASAQSVLEKASATQAEVDAAKAAIDAASGTLVARLPVAKTGVETEFEIIVGKSKQLTLSDFVDENGLSSITYAVSAADDKVTVSEIAEGKFTVTAGSAEAETSVAITVKYKGEVKLTVTVTVKVISEKAPELKANSVTEDIDLFSAEDKTKKTINFASNVKDYGVELTYTVTCNGDPVTMDETGGTSYTLTYGSLNLTDRVTQLVYSVKISYTVNDTPAELNYTYTLNIKDTRDYRVANGGFDNGLDDWTMSGDIGEISENGEFWKENFPMFNDGKYFRGDGKQANVGTLTSSPFKIGGINKISFKLGAGVGCYVTLEETNGTVLALWRNTKFNDIGTWHKVEIGKTEFALNLVQYVADVGDWSGKTVILVIHDESGAGFGFVTFDELVTYYAKAEDVPLGAFAAVNELADKTELSAAVEGAVAEQGDYTEESFTDYRAAVTAAQAVFDKLSATQAEVDAAKAAIDTAFGELELREPAEKQDADTNVALLVNGSKEITISEYVDEKGLSSISYTASATDNKLTVGNISQGKFTVSASEVLETTLTITVLYKGEATGVTVILTVKVTNGTPSVKVVAKEKNIDLYNEANTTDITLDFAENLNNPAELTFSYTVTMDGSPVTLTDTSCYTLTYGTTYTETATSVVFSVQVAYTLNETPATLSYTYTLNIKDTRDYRIVNGDFDHGTQENDLDGWILRNSKLGSVSSDTHYWLGDDESADGYPFGNDKKFFSAYANGEESAMGTLTSLPFKIGGSGWITYQLGGAKNADKVYIDIVEASTGNILARYSNSLWKERTDGKKSGCTLISYKADLSAFDGKTVYVRIVDNAIGDYGLFFVDSFVTYYATVGEVPAYNEATSVEHPADIYQIYNGGFDKGTDGLAGWTLSNEDLGAVNEVETYWGNVPFNNEGKFFNAYATDKESATGTLTSPIFTIGGSGWISYKLGGAKNIEQVKFEIVSASDETKCAVLPNFDWSDDDSQTNVRGCTLIAYKANLLSYGFSAGDSVYIRITDNATGDYGLVFLDSVVTYYEQEPDSYNQETGEGFRLVAPTRLLNGGFEFGNLTGWTLVGGEVPGSVTNASTYFNGTEYKKEKTYLFTAAEGRDEDVHNPGMENVTGTIRSSTFTLKANAWISFKLGGGNLENLGIKIVKTDGTVLARFQNTNVAAEVGQLVQYKYHSDNTEDVECYIEIFDNEPNDSGNIWRLVVVDDICVNLNTEPSDGIVAINKNVVTTNN